MTADNSSSHKKTSYKGVIVFGIIALFLYGAWTKVRVDICISDAGEVYEKDWAAACKKTAKVMREGYADCVNGAMILLPFNRHIEEKQSV
jgi:hypothetical protein